MTGQPAACKDISDAVSRQPSEVLAKAFVMTVLIGQNSSDADTEAPEMNETDDFDAPTSPATDQTKLAEGLTSTPCIPADEARLQACIARIVHQDEQALAELYEALAGRVYGLALRITRQVQTAEEVTEDAFWQVWRQAPRFDSARGSVLAWVLTIARSRALDALRRRDPAETLDEEQHADQRGAENDPQDLLLAVQRQHRLHAALQDLDPLPRQLLALAFFRDLSHEEIACQMCLPLGTVKSHIRRALLRLRRLLGADDPRTPMVTP
ncbi:MAG TPA: sigma-70 family RNA polymerase sigma factor [Accumulibacter sp.]|uniref:Sigma-K factor n=3 Tax=Candidatus Accumulibacter TaxID=327159 RepID=A0A080MBD5_9PROT|nr:MULTISPECIES: sigma-70 family RNA polymerase sigma factor [Candidatus Accumulibacter]KFB78612.1 MAG: Sigma-K factor [Candidatus Accumulibacter cognatus]MCC2866434.1 sigma-70 family RNA polymerase sigma factor [Candidatus Accumulibacter phosphatis]MCM8581023.1 sigma-70 family RNA polymerase sigma factor [Accumulibacter sp.]MCM8621332.1 sigma-70 family RNA polymerase sigma factor [Accumulibacter sp.]MCQ1551429.1 sigma-70 family RNA polymerase sigma factor [Candidatus Accumulibacter phosphatis